MYLHPHPQIKKNYGRDECKKYVCLGTIKNLVLNLRWFNKKKNEDEKRKIF